MLFFGVSQHLEHFRQDPPNKWLLEGIATGEQVAFEAGQKKANQLWRSGSHMSHEKNPPTFH